MDDVDVVSASVGETNPQLRSITDSGQRGDEQRTLLDHDGDGSIRARIVEAHELDVGTRETNGIGGVGSSRHRSSEDGQSDRDEEASGDGERRDTSSHRPERGGIDREGVGRRCDLGRVTPGSLVRRKGSGWEVSTDVVRLATTRIVGIAPRWHRVLSHEELRLVIVRPHVFAGRHPRRPSESRYHRRVLSERTDDHWFALTPDPLSIGDAYEWAVHPGCGAVVVFSGTVRDHAEEAGVRREGVTHLVYEAYDEQVLPRFSAIVDEMRARWSDLGRVVLWHRVGRLELGESSVVVAVSSPHRPDAFVAARFAIDAVKSSAPVWKLEEWSDGRDWGTGATSITDATRVASVDEATSR